MPPIMKFTLRTFCLHVILFGLFSNLNAQPIVRWDSTYGGSYRDWGHDFALTTDGGFILASEVTSGDGHVQMSTDPDGSGIHSVIPGLPSGSEDFWVTKLDAQGKVMWQNALGGTSAEVATSIIQTSDGGYAVCGFGGSTNGDFLANEVDGSGIHSGGGLFGGDVWIVKLDANGNIQWHNALGGSRSDMGHDVIQTSDGGYLIVGDTYSMDGDAAAATDVDGSGNHSASTPDVWVIKLDAGGNLQWHNVLGGTSFDYGGTAIETATGYMIAATSSSNNGDLAIADVDNQGPHGSYDFWVMHLDFNGQMQWHNVIGGSSLDIIYASPGIIRASDGNYILGGRSSSTNWDAAVAQDVDGSTQHGNQDFWVVKITPAGQVLWHNHIGTPSWDEIESLSNACDGGIVCSGFSDHVAAAGDKSRANPNGARSPWMVKLNLAGQIEWEHAFGSGGPNFDGPSHGLTFSMTKDYVVNTDGRDYFVFTSSQNAPGGDKGARNIGNYDAWFAKFGFQTIADFTWDTVCFGTPTSFTDSSFFTNVNPAHRYQWDFGDPASGAQNTSTLQNPQHTFTAPGTYNVQLITLYECESDTVDYNVYVEPPINLSLGNDTMICGTGSVLLNAGTGHSSYLWDNSTTNPTRLVTNPGTYWVTVTGLVCTATDSVNVTIEPIKTHTAAVTICQGQTHFAAGALQSTSGIYVDTLVSAAGCDSIHTTNLTVTPPVTAAGNITICQGGSAVVHGIPVAAAGVYVDTVTASTGCDSISSITVNVNPIIMDSSVVMICQGQSATIHGNAQSVAGYYSDTAQTGSGCDSVSTVQLILTPAITTSNTLTICTGGNTLVHGQVVSAPGVYIDTLPSVGGCDSISTITVNQNPPLTNSVNVTICQGTTHWVGGANQGATGIYVDTLQNAAGCDSILTTNLTVTPAITSNSNVVICTGGSATVHGIVVTQAGAYVDTLQTASGCDSISTVTVAVANILTHTANVNICQGQTYWAGGANQSTTGIYVDTLQTPGGCDSVVATNLNVTPTIITNTPVTICEGTQTIVHGLPISVAGVYVDTLASASGCDSVSTVTVAVTPTVRDSAVTTICDGQNVNIHGTAVGTSGFYADTLQSYTGCDSISVVELVVNATYTSVENHTLCDGDTVMINGSPYHDAQSFTVTYASTTGCDSAVTYEIERIHAPVVDLGPNVEECDGNIVDLYIEELPEDFTFAWWDGSDDYTRSVSEAGTYWITVTHPLCYTIRDTVDVSFKDCNFYIYTPSAFTPNGDPFNGVFKPKIYGELDEYEMLIYDRWGELLFRTTETSEGWDGTYQGNPVKSDVYVCKINYRALYQEKKQFIGRVTLLR